MYEHGPFLFRFKGGKDEQGLQRQELELTANPYRCALFVASNGSSGCARNVAAVMWRCGVLLWEAGSWRVRRGPHGNQGGSGDAHKPTATLPWLACPFHPPPTCSWSTVANVLYVDSPAGVGMSYYERKVRIGAARPLFPRSSVDIMKRSIPSQFCT